MLAMEQHLMEYIHGFLVMAWNILIFGVDNASSFHADNHQNNFWYQVKNQLIILMAVFVQQKRSIILSKANTKILLDFALKQ